MFYKFKKSLRDWYYGVMVDHAPTGDEKFDNFLRAYSALYPKRHWTSKLLQATLSFCGEHWQWLIGIFLSIASMIIATPI